MRYKRIRLDRLSPQDVFSAQLNLTVYATRGTDRLAEFVVVEKAADGTVVQEITVEESDIPKPLRDAFRDAGRAILDDIITWTKDEPE